jgi:transcriptional regulator with XRE-family HTH domain
MRDVLCEAVKKSGLSANQLAKETGVFQQTLSEFLRGKGIRLETAEKLAAYFGLELKPRKE